MKDEEYNGKNKAKDDRERRWTEGKIGRQALLHYHRVFDFPLICQEYLCV